MKRRLLSVILSVAMVMPGFASAMPVTAATPVDNAEQNIRKQVLWSTSFEEDEADMTKFKVSATEDTKGSRNIQLSASEGLTGDVTRFVDKSSISGSSNFNSDETKEKLFDGSTGTKWLTSANTPSQENPIKLTFSLTESDKIVTTYAITSANDVSDRDPMDWAFKGSRNGSDWTVLDTQSNQVFGSRFEQKVYTFENTEAFQYFSLEITKNAGNSLMTQFSEFVVATGNTADDEIFEYKMYSDVCNGPADVWNQSANVGWTGSKALQVSGAQTDGDSYAYNVLFDNVNTQITEEDTYLSYVIFPSMSGSNYDYNYTQMYMAIDLKFTDGTYLSDLDVLDQNENRLDPVSQGESRTLTSQQWNRIYAKIPSKAIGKTVDQVLAAFKKDTKEAEGSVNFRTYFDDIEIYTKADSTYEHLSDYVSILRGTNDSPGFSRGLTAPAVTMPHGFNFWVPVTNHNDNNIYDYEDDAIRYFTISHEPSYWIGDRGTWQFMVNTSLGAESTGFSSGSIKSAFSHDNEVAKANYYSVEFDKDSGDAKGSRIEITPTIHGSVVRAAFDSGVANRNLIFDCIRAGGGITFSEDKQSFTAYSDHTGNGSKRMYVYGEFSQTPVSTKVSGGQGIARFADDVEAVELKLATSYISEEQAKKNLELEMEGKDFDTVAAEAQQVWDDKLSVITEVEGATEEQLITLYSNLYRLFMYPNTMSENMGSNESPDWYYKSPYRNDDSAPVSGEIYINNGFWDTYRTAWSAYALLTPETDTKLLNGLVQHYNDQSWIPRWIAPGGTNSMVGTSSDVVFADAAVKGIDFDLENAYASALRNAATVSDNLTGGGRKNLETSIFKGYTAGGDENFSWSLEGYINDFGISQMAKYLKENTNDPEQKAEYESDYLYYVNRAKNYTLLFDDAGDSVSEKWLRGKNSNGTWNDANNTDDIFDPVRWAGNFTETNGYNMAASVPQDGQGIANLYGGRDALAEKLDTIMTTDTPFSGYGAENGVGGIHEQKESREVKMGQYGHNNQPSHHILYMYNYAGQPWKTQEYVRDVLDRCYTGASFGQGYIGDEDNGEMSAWYIFSALGFYPTTVGSDEYTIGSPLFDSATVNMENGKTITIHANNNSKENVYVQSMTLNGESYTKNYLKHENLKDGAAIVFNMGSEPNTAWGSDTDALPSSLTAEDETPSAIADLSDNAAVRENKTEISTVGVSAKEVWGNISSVSSLIDDTSATEAALDPNTTITFADPLGQKVKAVTLTSGKTVGTAPSGVKIYGAKNGDSEWETLADYEDVTFTWKQYTRPFAIDQNKVDEYNFYKVELTGGSALAEIEFLGDSDVVNELTSLIAAAKAIDTGELPQKLADLLTTAITSAENVLDKENATEKELNSAYTELKTCITRTQNIKNGFEKIEAEKYDAASSAIVDDGPNIGGVKKGSWVKYNDVLFDSDADYFEIYYSAQPSDAGGVVQVYLDSKDKEGDTPIFTIDVPKTNGWSDYRLVSTTFQAQTEGLHDVYLVFTNNTSDPYVSNVDWFRFESDANVENKAAAKAVFDMIEAIGEVTLDKGTEIEETREAYDALTAKQKAFVTNLDVLTQAEAEYTRLQQQESDKEEAGRVSDMIAAIGEVTLDKETEIIEAREAYDALSDEQKALVTNQEVLIAAETAYIQLLQQQSDEEAAERVSGLIAAIGEVTPDKKATIEFARAAYDALSDNQKELVNNLDVLTQAEVACARLLQQEKDKEAAGEVSEMIAAIGEVTLDKKAAIEEARAAYDALTDEQKALVDNLNMLIKAEKDYKELETDSRLSAAVEKLIHDIGTVSYNAASKAKIDAARAAYNKLTVNQKQLVTNYSKLTAAETRYETLKKQAEAVKVGQTYMVGSYKYKVTSLKKLTVKVTGVKKKSLRKISVKDTVKIKGKTFKVTAIGKSAFKNCKKATGAVIGKNVKTIESKAFYNCKELKKIKINSTVLTKAGSKAFYKCNKLKSITVNSKKLNKYKGLLENKGQKKSVKIIKQ